MTKSLQIADKAMGTLLILRLGSNLYGLPVGLVEEVLPAIPIEPVELASPDLLGVVYVRGHLIPVINTAYRLGIRSHQRLPESHIICLQRGDGFVGIEVDEAMDLLELPEEQPLSPHQLILNSKMLLGVVEYEGAIIRILNPDGIAALPEEITSLVGMGSIS